MVGHTDRRRGHRDCTGRPAGRRADDTASAYVTQDPTIYNDLRIIYNVRYFAELYGTESKR